MWGLFYKRALSPNRIIQCVTLFTHKGWAEEAYEKRKNSEHLSDFCIREVEEGRSFALILNYDSHGIMEEK